MTPHPNATRYDDAPTVAPLVAAWESLHDAWQASSYEDGHALLAAAMVADDAAWAEMDRLATEAERAGQVAA